MNVPYVKKENDNQEVVGGKEFLFFNKDGVAVYSPNRKERRQKSPKLFNNRKPYSKRGILVSQQRRKITKYKTDGTPIYLKTNKKHNYEESKA